MLGAITINDVTSPHVYNNACVSVSPAAVGQFAVESCTGLDRRKAAELQTKLLTARYSDVYAAGGSAKCAHIDSL